TADVLYLQGEIALVERSLCEAVNAVVQGEGWVDIYSRMFSLQGPALLDCFHPLESSLDVPLLREDQHVTQ
ncbi:hypothetical protein, partial [Rhizobium leguminosarum]|uniref:hypothetical protein n=1 Tax=Rhizobium leguminosarum TaxID=384 RepID=UPI003F9A246F